MKPPGQVPGIMNPRIRLTGLIIYRADVFFTKSMFGASSSTVRRPAPSLGSDSATIGKQRLTVNPGTIGTGKE